MAPLARREFEALLRRIDEATFRRFVAALWRERGWDVRPAGDLLIVGRDGEDRRLRVHHTSPGPRIPRSFAVGRRGSPGHPTMEVDAVVTNAPHRRRATDPKPIDAGDLYRICLYAIDRGTCDRLFRRFFDRPLEGSTPTAVRVGARLRGLGERLEAPALPSRSTVAVLLGVLLLVVGASGALPSGNGPEAPVGSSPGIAGAGGPSSTPNRLTAAPTLTDAPGETSGDRRTGSGFPPGLAPSGITDAGQLAEGHAQSITGRSYRWELTYREFVDGRGSALRRERVRVESPTHSVSRVWGMGDPRGSGYVIADASSYSDGRDRFEAERSPDGMQYAVERAGRLQGGEGYFADRAETYVRWFLSVRESDVVDVEERGGITYYWVLTIGDPWPGVENTTGSALVDSRGIVHEIHRTYDVPGTDGVSASVTLRYTELGNATAEPPGWLEAARNATGVTADR